jgi:hypothetical protein
MDQSISDDISAEVLIPTDSSSGGSHSNYEEIHADEHLSALELENKLLKSEVTSLNQEMTSVIQRAKNSQEGKGRY